MLPGQRVDYQLSTLLGSPNALWRARARAPWSTRLFRDDGARPAACHGAKGLASCPGRAELGSGRVGARHYESVRWVDGVRRADAHSLVRLRLKTAYARYLSP